MPSCSTPRIVYTNCIVVTPDYSCPYCYTHIYVFAKFHPIYILEYTTSRFKDISKYQVNKILSEQPQVRSRSRWLPSRVRWRNAVKGVPVEPIFITTSKILSHRTKMEGEHRLVYRRSF